MTRAMTLTLAAVLAFATPSVRALAAEPVGPASGPNAPLALGCPDTGGVEFQGILGEGNEESGAFAAAVTVPLANGGQAIQRIRVEPAPEWDALLDFDCGWIGGDGIYSIPANTDERAGAYATTDTLFIFSDTFVGELNPDGSRQDLFFVNNSAAIRSAGEPWAKPLEMIINSDPESGEPTHLFPPSVPGVGAFDWYWLKDGITLDGTTYIFASWWSSHPQFLLVRKGIVLIEIPPGDPPPFRNHSQREVPLYVPDHGNDAALVFGGSIMPNTVAAGAPDPDGFIYIYGTRERTVEDPLNKRIYVARVPEAEFADLDAWRFWDGTGWVSTIEDSAAIADNGSIEHSVSVLPNGLFVMVFQFRQITPKIGVRIATSPWGPFGDVKIVYQCPEANLLESIICYNAKAHPHLSRPGELLVSYNVNTLKQKDQRRFGDIYRPRFFRIIAE